MDRSETIGVSDLVLSGYVRIIEHNCEWVSFDRDFARLEGLRWRSPLD